MDVAGGWTQRENKPVFCATNAAASWYLFNGEFPLQMSRRVGWPNSKPHLWQLVDTIIIDPKTTHQCLIRARLSRKYSQWKYKPNSENLASEGSHRVRKVQFFWTLFKRGGGSNPCSKIMSEIVVCSGGHLTTWNLHEKGLLRHWWWNLGVK